jgi:hypothetical protein
MSRSQLISISNNKSKAASFEAFVTYEDSPKGGNRYMATRKAHVEELKDDAIAIMALEYENRQVPR